MGIDLTSAEAKPSACLGLDKGLQLKYSGYLNRDSDIVNITTEYDFAELCGEVEEGAICLPYLSLIPGEKARE